MGRGRLSEHHLLICAGSAGWLAAQLPALTDGRVELYVKVHLSYSMVAVIWLESLFYN